MGGGPFTTIFSDYRDFGGQTMPARTVVRQAGQEIALTIASVEFDTATDAAFALPVEIQKMVASASKPPPADPSKPKGE
jgi:predicted methyltransferase